ncbi:MAG: phosphoadenosine phosphosulfate reductase family protein [Sulfurimonas sp.]|jgi:3'-phosphoadenosine 5'-phosphosulfate sulfotransferase (PAPS reductase)/FAD synthetase
MKYIASISGGQDSTAMTVRMLELGMPLDYIVFCDTGNEFKEMYAYLDRLDIYLQSKFNIGITRLKSKSDLKSLCFTPFTKGKQKGKIRGLPYSSSMSFCTRDLKKNVSERFMRTLKDDCIQYIGYVSREKNRVHQSDKKYITLKFPLIEWGWNESEVSAFLKEKTLFNELYNHFSRTGCKFCPKQSLDSWYALYAHHPAEFEEAKRWEDETKNQNAHIKNFRSDYSMIQLEKRFEKRLNSETKVPQFQFDWNEENVSCMCK